MTWLGRYSKQSGESQSGFWSKHELLADEEGIEAGCAKFRQVVVGAKAGFADSDATFWNVLNQIK